MLESTRNKLIAAAASIAAIGLTIAAHTYEAHVDAVIVDAGVSRTTGIERVTDLLTGAVEPNETVTTGVMLPAGATVTDVSGTFEIVSQSTTPRGDGLWLEVVARNPTEAPLRFIGFVTFTMGDD